MDETFLSFAARKIKETASMEEGTRRFITGKDMKKRSTKPSDTIKVGESEKDPNLGAPNVCKECGQQFKTQQAFASHMQSEHGRELQEERFPFGPG